LPTQRKSVVPEQPKSILKKKDDDKEPSSFLQERIDKNAPVDLNTIFLMLERLEKKVDDLQKKK